MCIHETSQRKMLKLLQFVVRKHTKAAKRQMGRKQISVESLLDVHGKKLEGFILCLNLL